MSETPYEYTQRILKHMAGKQPMGVQAATPKKLARLIKGVSTAKLRKRPAPGKWSVAEIITHLSDTELVGGFRMRLIMGAPGTPIAAFDQDAWVTSGHYEKRDPRKSLEQFRVLRESNLALLKSLTPQQWKQYGMHAERGQESIEHIVRMFAGHDLNHLQQIERALSQ
jgi:hypothetical protein